MLWTVHWMNSVFKLDSLRIDPAELFPQVQESFR